MKKRIIITEKQYEEIFFNQKNKNIIKEQLLSNLGRKIGDVIKKTIDNKGGIFNSITDIEEKLKIPGKSKSQIKDLTNELDYLKKKVDSGEAIRKLIPEIDEVKNILGVNEIRTIEELEIAFYNKKFTKDDIENLYNIPEMKKIVIDVFSNDKEVKKLFSFYNTLKDKVKPGHPDLLKIEEIINKQIPNELEKDITSTISSKIEKSEIKGSSDKLESLLPDLADEFKISKVDLKSMLFKLDQLDDLVSIVRSKKIALDEISTPFIRMWSEKDKKIWKDVIYDLEKNNGKKIKENIEELKYYIKKNDINLDDFMKKISRLTPSLPFKKLMLKLSEHIGSKWAGRIYYFGILLFWGPTILYTIYKINTTTKPKSDNSLEGFISFIEVGLKSDSEKLKLFKDLLNDKKIELKLDSIDKTKWFIIDKEGELTGEKQTLTYKWDGNTFKRIDKQKFENSLKGFTTWYTTPIENGGKGKKIGDDFKIEGIKDLFKINIKSEDGSLEEGPSYEFIDGTFRYKKKI